MNSVGTAWIFALMFLICADVISRGLLDPALEPAFKLIPVIGDMPMELVLGPIRGVHEIVSFSIVAIVFLQLANTLHTGRITRADVIIDWLLRKRPTGAAIYQFLFHGIGVVVFAIIALGTYPEFIEAWVANDFYGVQGEFTSPEWPIRFVILGGSVSMAVQFAVYVVRDARVLVTGEPEHHEAVRGAPVGWPAIFTLIGAIALGYLIGFENILATQFGGEGLTGVQIGALSIVAMLVMIYAGMHIGVALIALSFLGIWLIKDDPGLGVRVLALAAHGTVNNYIFGVVPLFVLMGLLVNTANIGKDTFEVAQWMLERVKGGLGVATVAANAVFAAITGVSIASAAVFTRVAVPPLMEQGYTPRFAVGVVAGSSVLGMLIPPSILMIIYALVTETSVGMLFASAVVPGLILASAFALAIVAMAVFWPNYVGTKLRIGAEALAAYPPAWSRRIDVEASGLAPRQKLALIALTLAVTGVLLALGWPSLTLTLAAGGLAVLATITGGKRFMKLVPIVVLIGLVLGGIYGGLFTPTEAGAAGALAALIIALVKRRLSWKNLWQVLVETGHISVAILFLIIAANMYGRMLSLSGLPANMMSYVAGADLGFYGTIAVYLVVVLLLGMILDSVSIMLLTLPLILPFVTGAGADLIWFGIVTVIAVEIGLLTPPLGLTVYVVKASLGNSIITLGDIFIGAFPFVVIMVFVTILLVAVPELSNVDLLLSTVSKLWGALW
ncbi:MAG: TRAP transporter large permease subunit [Alphaproteobacteria bacterium]